MSQLLAHFNRLAEAPGAVPRLRRFILDLAVRGKLVEQDARDEPAFQLIERIREQKRGLAQGTKASASMESVELGFPLPSGWQAASFGEVLVDLQTGPFGSSLHQSDYEPGGIPVVNPASIRNERIVPVDAMCVGRATLERLSTFKLRAGDIVMARRGEMGRCAVVTDAEDGWLCGTGSLILRFPKSISTRFVVMLIGSPIVRDYLGGSAVGATMQNLNQSILLDLVVGLPPLAEQHRIVAKVDELMALCDRLEAAHAEREWRRERLVSAALSRLSNSETSVSAENARFLLRHIGKTMMRLEHIPELRQALLNLAVRGNLVVQDPSDAPAPTFGEVDVAAAQAKLQMALPEGWSWTRVENVAEARLGKMLDKAKNSGRLHPYLRNTNVHWFQIKLELKELRIQESEVEKYLLKMGDVLICEGGHGIGRTAVWRSNAPDVVFQKALHRVRPGPKLNGDFFSYCMCVYFQAGVLQSYFTGVGIPHFTGKALSVLGFPLPPLAEQHRIVAKVDELMAICDRLEAQLETAQTESRRLLEAVLHKALAVA